MLEFFVQSLSGQLGHQSALDLHLGHPYQCLAARRRLAPLFFPPGFLPVAPPVDALVKLPGQSVHVLPCQTAVIVRMASPLALDQQASPSAPAEQVSLSALAEQVSLSAPIRLASPEAHFLPTSASSRLCCEFLRAATQSG